MSPVRLKSSEDDKMRMLSTLGEWGAPLSTVTHHFTPRDVNARSEVPRTEMI